MQTIEKSEDNLLDEPKIKQQIEIMAYIKLIVNIVNKTSIFYIKIIVKIKLPDIIFLLFKLPFCLLKCV